ncbi:MAG: hypothetical protein ACYS22_20545 [Planctomycetota bacterium]
MIARPGEPGSPVPTPRCATTRPAGLGAALAELYESDTITDDEADLLIAADGTLSLPVGVDPFVEVTGRMSKDGGTLTILATREEPIAGDPDCFDVSTIWAVGVKVGD